MVLGFIPNFFSLFSSRVLDKESYYGQIEEITLILVYSHKFFAILPDYNLATIVDIDTLALG